MFIIMSTLLSKGEKNNIAATALERPSGEEEQHLCTKGTRI